MQNFTPQKKMNHSAAGPSKSSNMRSPVACNLVPQSPKSSLRSAMFLAFHTSRKKIGTPYYPENSSKEQSSIADIGARRDICMPRKHIPAWRAMHRENSSAPCEDTKTCHAIPSVIDKWHAWPGSDQRKQKKDGHTDGDTATRTVFTALERWREGGRGGGRGSTLS